MFLTISMIVIIAALLWSAWKAFSTPGNTVYRAISVAITAFVIVFIGYTLPWMGLPANRGHVVELPSG